MDQPPQDEPKRGTQPMKRPATRPFGDKFVATGKPQGAPSAPGTRALPSVPAGPLKQIVPQKLAELRQELDGIQRLIAIFTQPILVLRYAMFLAEPPPAAPPALAAMVAYDPFGGLARPDPDDPAAPREAEHSADPIPAEFRELKPGLRILAQEVCEVLKADFKVKQRAQVALHQYEEAAQAQRDGTMKLDQLYKMTYEDAWERLADVGIERIKGKAYPISGFFDHFKRDPVISRVFPAPRSPAAASPGAQGTAPLGSTAPLPAQSAAGSGPMRPPAQPPQPARSAPPAQSQAQEGLLGKLKGLFGKL